MDFPYNFHGQFHNLPSQPKTMVSFHSKPRLRQGTTGQSDLTGLVKTIQFELGVEPLKNILWGSSKTSKIGRTEEKEKIFETFWNHQIFLVFRAYLVYLDLSASFRAATVLTHPAVVAVTSAAGGSIPFARANVCSGRSGLATRTGPDINGELGCQAAKWFHHAIWRPKRRDLYVPG